MWLPGDCGPGPVITENQYLIFIAIFSQAARPSRELGPRIVQSSEFSILVAYLALSVGMLSTDTAMFIQLATIVSFIVSTYWIVLKYPTTIAVNARLCQDLSIHASYMFQDDRSGGREGFANAQASN
jgi:hypothetical protein